jgi:hypothetical protein
MDILASFLLIETTKFPILPAEDSEIVNEGMYGKALCNYLQNELPAEGIEVSFSCPEDWGWWVEVRHQSITMGLCIYSDSSAGCNPEKYALCSSIQPSKKWSWSKFKKLDNTSEVNAALEVIDAVERICKRDPEIQFVSRHTDFPF